MLDRDTTQPFSNNSSQQVFPRKEDHYNQSCERLSLEGGRKGGGYRIIFIFEGLFFYYSKCIYPPAIWEIEELYANLNWMRDCA